MNTRRFTLLVTIALAGALIACSTTSADNPSSGTGTGSTNATITTTETIAVASSSEPSVITSEEASDVTPETSSSSAVDGFGLAGDDLVNAEAAWAAYQAFLAFYKQAAADPSAVWSAQLAQLTGDPLIVNAQSDLTRQARLGTKITDQSTIQITGITPHPSSFDFNVCVDQTATTIVDKVGKDVKAPNAPGSYYRHPSVVYVDLQDGTWRTVDERPNYQAQC